ncbi:MAG: MCE family protein [Rhodospirillales bacterium]|nr:MCE family protein [Rhodospirillales bacterium]
MSKQASPKLIGAFVLGALVLALAAVIILGGGRFFARQIPVVMYFDGSLAGLSPGSPITFRGVRVGQVTNVFLRFDEGNSDILIPIFGVIEPDQVKLVSDSSAAEIRLEESRAEGLKNLIEKGLRAQLAVGSLVTGQMTVNLDLYAGAGANVDAGRNPYPDRVEIPTVPSTIEAVQDTLKTVIQKVSQLPLDQILEEVRGTTNSVTKILNDPQLREVVPNLNAALVNFRSLSASLNGTLGSLTAQLDKASGKADETFEQARSGFAEMQRAFAAVEQASTRASQTMASANAMLQPNSSIFFDLSTALREITNTARSMRSLSDTLSRDPNSILFGRSRPGGVAR